MFSKVQINIAMHTEVQAYAALFSDIGSNIITT